MIKRTSHFKNNSKDQKITNESLFIRKINIRKKKITHYDQSFRLYYLVYYISRYSVPEPRTLKWIMIMDYLTGHCLVLLCYGHRRQITLHLLTPSADVGAHTFYKKNNFMCQIIPKCRLYSILRFMIEFTNSVEVIYIYIYI